MAVSRVLAAKRKLVSLLLTIAGIYSVLLRDFNRESPDKDVERAYKRVLLKAHPDKGGSNEHTQKLTDAKAEWDAARSSRGGGNVPSNGGSNNASSAQQSPGGGSANSNIVTKNAPAGYEFWSSAVLLTYHKVRDLPQWERFTHNVADSLQKWGVRYWCATLETCKNR